MNITAIQQALIELGWLNHGLDTGSWCAKTDTGYVQACIADNMHPSTHTQPSCAEQMPPKVQIMYATYADTSYASLETAEDDADAEPVADAASTNVSESAVAPAVVTAAVVTAPEPTESELETARLAAAAVATAVDAKGAAVPVASKSTKA